MYYKLTDENMQTHGDFQWEFDKWYAIDKKLRGKRDLCTDAWFHCYDDPLFAAMLNPAHADITEPRLFRCRVKGKRRVDGGDKYGFTMMMIPAGSEMELPVITTTQRIAFGILCAMEVYKDPDWTAWARNWLDGKDRTTRLAEWIEKVTASRTQTVRIDNHHTILDHAAMSAKRASEAAAKANWSWSTRIVPESVGSAVCHAAIAFDKENPRLDYKQLIQKAMEF